MCSGKQVTYSGSNFCWDCTSWVAFCSSADQTWVLCIIGKCSTMSYSLRSCFPGTASSASPWAGQSDLNIWTSFLYFSNTIASLTCIMKSDNRKDTRPVTESWSLAQYHFAANDYLEIDKYKKYWDPSKIKSKNILKTETHAFPSFIIY